MDIKLLKQHPFNSLNREQQVAIRLEVLGVSVDIDDLQLLSKYVSWGIVKGKNTFYCYYIMNRKRYFIHRLITNCPESLIVDHRNGNGLDNRKYNLRITTTAGNALNKIPTKGRALPRGVSLLQSGNFRVKIKNKHVGTFVSLDTAIQAYNKELNKLLSNISEEVKAWIPG